MTEPHNEGGLWSQAGMGAGQTGVGAPANGVPLDGLSWSWDLDLEALVAAVSDPAPWEHGATARTSSAAADPAPATDPDPVEAEFAEYLEAVEAGRSHVLPLTVAAGRIAESVPPGPELAVWADAGPVTGLEDGALAGMAASYRRLASWAQAGELAAVAELTSRSAAADHRIGVDKQGCPARIPDSASAEVSLALTMSQSAASWWTDLAVTLRWRLAATGAALRNGTIDLARARAIAEATAALDEDTARTVQDKVLPKAGDQTLGQLRAALRRAVIAADPAGADRRREEAERRAKVTLYPDPEGTASLAGYNLPGITATAAFARITALARALKATGAGGGIDLLRSQVLLGLLLGTLPYIPPADGAPPDAEPPDPEPPDEPPGPDPEPPDDPPDDQPPDDPSDPDASGECPLDDGPPTPTDWPIPGALGSHGAWGSVRDEPTSAGADDGGLGARPPPAWPEIPPLVQAGPAAMGNLPPLGGRLLELRLPWSTLAADGSEPGYLSRLGPITPAQARRLADLASRDPAVRWRVIVTDPDGRAVAVSRIRGAHQKADGLISQVTVTISEERLTGAQDPGLPPVLGRLLASARSAAADASEQAAADADAGGCAHTAATAAYRPTRHLWDFITARDLTCRFRTCRQPAIRGDLDHTTPYDQGGATCSCNLGAACRYHHKIKQHPGWRLDQASPGTFTWTTPTGRTYFVQPDTYVA